MSSEIYESLGLQANPFPPGACKDFYYQTEATKRILDELLYGIAARKGFLVLVGEVGLGKTSLLLQLLPQLEREGVRTSWVFNTVLDKTELLAAIARDFGIAIPEAPHLAELLDTLHAFFLKANKEGGNCAIIIDEAHLLDFQAMEVLRMLSNLEVGGEKLVQILLAGQPELRQRLNQPEMRQLRSRINLYHELPPLGSEETGNYVNFKLSMVGSELKLEGRALKMLGQASGGNFRRINLLMEKTLYALVARDERRLSAAAVMDGLRDVAAWDSDLACRLRRIQLLRFLRLLGAALFAGLALVLLLLFWQPWSTAPPSREQTAQEEVFQPEERVAGEATQASPTGADSDTQQALEEAPDSPDVRPNAATDATAELPDQEKDAEQGTGAVESAADAAQAPLQITEQGQGASAEAPQPSRELARSAEDFLEPWGLAETLQQQLLDALLQKAPAVFSQALAAARLPEQMPIYVIELQEKPPRESGRISYFPWRRYADSGPAWLALWRPPLTLTQYAMEERSRDVVALQEQLDLLGYYRMGIDGKVGPGTWKAVEQFQADHGLPVTGIPDEKTVFWLFHTDKRAAVLPEQQAE